MTRSARGRPTVVATSSGLRIVDGKFWMAMRLDVRTSLGATAHGRFGRPMLAWPGRRVYGSREAAEQAAAEFALRMPQFPFAVVEAVAAFASPRQRFDRAIRRPL